MTTPKKRVMNIIIIIKAKPSKANVPNIKQFKKKRHRQTYPHKTQANLFRLLELTHHHKSKGKRRLRKRRPRWKILCVSSKYTPEASPFVHQIKRLVYIHKSQIVRNVFINLDFLQHKIEKHVHLLF